MRLTKDEYGSLLSLAAKSRSEDPFTHCGAVGMTGDNRIVGIAYNGLTPGKQVPDWMYVEENRKKKTEFFIHAESNLYSLVKGDVIETVYINISPCIACCRTIASHGTKRVVYLQQYDKCDQFIEFMQFHGIECIKLPDSSKTRIRQFILKMADYPELLS